MVNSKVQLKETRKKTRKTLEMRECLNSGYEDQSTGQGLVRESQ